MEIKRTVHPIGQGGFFTEEFYEKDDCKYRVAYDCGGNSESSMTNYLIKKWKKINIDAIFISHLHYDHINGLQYLLDHTNVRYLFLPQMDDETILELWLHYGLYCTINPKFQNFIIHITNNNTNSYNDTRIIRVKYARNESIILDDNNRIILNQIFTNNIDSGTQILLDNGFPWLYIPYNPKLYTYISKNGFFSDYLKRKLYIDYGITISDKDLQPNNLPSITNTIINRLGNSNNAKTKNPIDIIKDIYKSYFNGNHNSYSMTLFSGLEKTENSYLYKIHYLDSWIKCPDLYHCFFHYCKKAYYYSPNCLYTGDYDANSNFSQLKTFYKPLWETIKTVQIPHHGSRHNHNDDLYEYPIKGFISAGVNNKYRHPHTDTLTKIGKNKCIPIIVTEDNYTKYEENIFI